MNIIINLFVLFLLLLLTSMFGYPSYANTNLFSQKIILFMIVFIYQFFILLISYSNQNKPIDMYQITINCLETSVAAVLGYTLWTDFLKQRIVWSGTDNNYKLHINIIIILFVAMVKSIRLLFTNTVE